MKEELRAQYVKSLEARIETIDTLEVKFREGNAIADQNIRLLAHALHGSGATFGFPAITKASAILEQAREEDLVPRMLDLKKILQKIITGYAIAFPDQAVASEKAQAPEKKGDEKHVLIIESDQGIVDQIASCLGQQNGKIKAVVAKDALHAEEQLLGGQLDLVILDLVLPDKDGRALLREIKIDFQMTVPVIVLSGITKDLVRVDCMSLGADRYLQKPIDSATLTRDISNLLAGEQKPSLSLVPMDEAEKEAGDETVSEEAELEDKAGTKVEAKAEAKVETRVETRVETKVEEVVHPPLEGITILVADDDEHLVELISHLMTDEGAQVKCVGNGTDAIDALRASPCSLAILDVNMPDMSGFDVLEKIRGELNMKGLPVILLTALGGEADIIRGYDLGANEYILKPFSEVFLVARVKSLLNHH